jgi:hypothetical protein
VLPARQYHSTDSHHVHFGDRVTDNGEGILTDFAVGGEVVRRVNKPIINLTSRNKLVDLDRASAVDLHGIDFLVLDDQVLPLCHLIAAGRILSGHNITGFGIYVLLLQTVTGLPVDPVEAYLFAEDDAG